MENAGQNYLENTIKLCRNYKTMAERAIAQVNDEQLNWQFNAEANSIAIIMRHMAGNSLSRWTNFMTEDGQKPWRNRDAEFETPTETRDELLALWEKGWQCMFDALESLTDADLLHIIYIRGEAHTVTEAVNRSLTHQAYHVGQIVYIAKMVSGESWKSLSIPKGQSDLFDRQKAKG